MDPTQELTARTEGARYVELDSLRGIAAFTVVLYHYRLAFDLREPWYVSPLDGGRSAVLLFFVLSGFVLSLSFWAKGRNERYGNYLTRRCFRIYVPYVAAVALAIVGVSLFPHSQLPLSAWFRNTWQSAVTPGLITRHLVMSGGDELNTAFWSLRYEVEMSIVFPLLLVVLRFVQPVLGIVFSVAVFAFADHRMQAGATDHWRSLELFKYGSLFAIGGILGRTLAWTRSRWGRLSLAGRLAILAAGLLLYFGTADALADKAHIDVPDGLFVSLGAAVLLLCCIYLGRLRAALRHRVPAYLGRISYSMYLVHGTMLFALLNLLYRRVPAPVFALVYIVATLAAAHLFCIAVEEPSLRAGKALAGRWKGQSA
ncbi:MAG: acyltransferase [Acidobacteriaceae bacterium]